MAISASIPVTVSAPSSVTPDLFEDFSTYTSTANFIADPRNIYRAGEDKNTQQMFLAVGEGLNGGKAIEYRYPAARITVDYTISRSIDAETLWGTNVTNVWWEQVVRFSDNFDMYDPTNPPSTGLKFMHAGVRNPQSSRFGGVIQQHDYQSRYLLGYPDNEQFITGIPGFDCSTMFGSGQWHTFRFRYKVNVPYATPNGICSVILPNGTTSNNQNLNIPRSNIFKLATTQNMNEKPATATYMSMFIGSITVYHGSNDPGWGI